MSRFLTEEHAVELLTDRLQFSKPYWSDSTEECARCAKALVDWLNRSKLTRQDVRLLKEVALAGFTFWRCPVCVEPVYEGAGAVEDVDPLWTQFQGVRENDRMSYPGDGSSDLRCNHCRCYMVGSNRLPELVS